MPPGLVRGALLALALLVSQGQSNGTVSVTLWRHRRLLDDGQRSGSYWGPRNLYASEYFGALAVGSPKQCLKVVFDTGSGNLVVPAIDCQDAACRSHVRYDAGRSNSSVPLRASDSPPETPVKEGRPRDVLTVTFGTGEITGVFVRDRVCVGDLCSRLTFITATNQSDEPFKDVPFDGILGLGLPQLAEDQGFSFVDALVKSGALKRNLFSVYIARGDGERSEILFGDVREELMVEPLLWAAVTNPGYWQVFLRDLLVGGEPLGFCSSGCQVAVDTGTSLLTAPARWARRLAEQLRVAGDCSNFDELPELGFLIGNRSLRLAPADYVDRSDDGCVLAVMALDVPAPRGPLFILGEPFLRKYYTVYDRERLRVGFALARQPVTGVFAETASACGEDAEAAAAALRQ